MDAVDLYWCLTCHRRLEVDGYSQAYCSPQCDTADRAPSKGLSLYSPPSQPTLSSLTDADDLEAEVCDPDDCSFSARLAPPIRNTWIGQGDAGILAWARSIPAGPPSDFSEPATVTAKPELISRAGAPVKPSLCMSRAQPAPPEPSRPILTPQQSLPSLSRDSRSIKSTSLVSLTTGSSSFSLPTPATGSLVGSLAVIDTSRQKGPKPGLLGGLKAHFCGLTSAGAGPSDEKRRSSTITRHDSEAGAAQSRPQKTRRAPSPVAFYHMPEEYSVKRKEASTRRTTKENARPATTTKYEAAAVEDHPAFRTRGRKTSRFPS
ncbi:hypothetical protein BD414DRAFT_409295 [Trametes punicea]|nr:hypothetical protein BD414DRAFT_409295 [Trametes punicea]